MNIISRFISHFGSRFLFRVWWCYIIRQYVFSNSNKKTHYHLLITIIISGSNVTSIQWFVSKLIDYFCPNYSKFHKKVSSIIILSNTKGWIPLCQYIRYFLLNIKIIWDLQGDDKISRKMYEIFEQWFIQGPRDRKHARTVDVVRRKVTQISSFPLLCPM